MQREWNGELYLLQLWKYLKFYRKACQKTVAKFSLTPSEVDVLMFLLNNAPLDTAADICRYKGISKGLVCRAVETLTERKMIVQKPDERDRRVVHLQLSEESREVREALKDCREDFFKRLTEKISVEKLEVFAEVVEEMTGNISVMEEKKHG